MSLYLIKRGPRPPHHNAPFHPVIICDRKRLADEGVSFTGDRDWVWRKDTTGKDGKGWLLIRWEGLIIDYGYLVRGSILPDGSHTAFWRDYETREGEGSVKDVLAVATWWSDTTIPGWLKDRGVDYAKDAFSQKRILELCAGEDGALRMTRPAHWPEAIDNYGGVNVPA